jgi:hypothetical protein
MAAIAPIKFSSIMGTLMRTTSATVGYDKTFDPEGRTPNGLKRWVDRSGGVAVGYPSMTLSVRPPSKASRLYKVTQKIDVPTLEQVSPAASGYTPAPTRAYSCAFIGEWLLPERSALAERQALFSYVLSTFLTTINASDDVPTDATGSPLRAAIENFDEPY